MASRPRRILIIEDNVDAASSLRDVLVLWHHEVSVAHNGRDGLDLARQYRPELVLCDIGLPDMDGYQVARSFGADEKLRGVTLVALSGHALPDEIARATAAGFRHHMSKPPSLDRLEKLLAVSVGTGAPPPAAAAGPPALAPIAPVTTAVLPDRPRPAASTAALRVLLVEDNPGDADLVREALAGDGARWQVDHVARLADCLARLDASGADVVVLDLTLPDASGLKGVEELARLRPDVPVVVLTGLADSEMGARAVQQGAQEYLVKAELEGRTLGRVLRYAVERHALARRAQELAREHATRAAADEARRHVMLLADASIAIASTLDERDALARLLRVLVPRLGSFAAVEWLEPGARVHCLVAMADADGQRREHELHARHPEAEAELVQRCAEPARIEPSLPEPRAPWADSWQQARQNLRLGSAMVLPLAIRREPLGMLTLAAATPYAAGDLAVTQEIARRAAGVVENARLYRQALDAVQVRDDFISIAGHELRTPLMSLLLDATRLGAVDNLAPDKLKAACQRVARCGDRLRALIDDLLDVSRIRTGRLLLECTEVELAALAREVAERYQPEIARVGSTLTFAPGGPIYGRWDRSRIQQVIANLLQNAIRYGAGKPIEIVPEQQDDVAHLWVRDHGCGIDPRDQDRIFERFERASGMIRKEGLGLGLWITREIVRAHGGSISVDSRPGEGAAFLVELPCAGPGPGPTPTPVTRGT
jgi:signal transduction histidine kinase